MCVLQKPLLLLAASILLASGVVRASNDTETTIIYFAYITALSGEFVTSGTIPAVELALEKINDRQDLLPGYTLAIDGEVGDSKCDRSTSLKAFFNIFTEDSNPKIAVIGNGCSVATEPVAEISQFFNTLHISYASSSTILNDRERFPNFWRTYPSEDNLASAVVAIVQQYNWRQLKIITEDETLFTATTDQLKAELESAGVFVDENGTTVFSQDDNLVEKDDLFRPEIRIYVLNMYSRHARRVLCAAVRAEETTSDAAFYHPGYVWITLGWYQNRWWTAEVENDPAVTCTDEQLERLLQRTLAIQQFPIAENGTARTDVSLTEDEFFTEYRLRLQNSGFSSDFTATHAYDAIWTLAFAINDSLPQLSLDNISSATLATLNATLSSNDFSFIGVSGEVRFDKNGTRVATNPRIQQYRDESRVNLCGKTGPSSIERVQIAVINNSQQFVYLVCEADNTTWPDGVPPDGTPLETFRTILQPLFILYSVLASLGILFAFFCLGFMLVFRNRKVVRLTSPNLNYVMIAGAILIYISVYFFLIPTTDKDAATAYCYVRAWTQPIGYFLSFGVIVLKMWRVYFIFRNRPVTKKRKPPQDWHLLIGVLIMTAIAITITGLGPPLDGYQASPVRDKELDSTRNDDNVIEEYFVLRCEGEGRIWIFIIYAYTLLTQGVAVYFAFRTRKVKIKALNDAKEISFVIYFTSVILTIMIIGAVTLEDFINADAAVFGAGLLIVASSVVGFVFIPKMIHLYRDPRGEKIFERSFSQTYPTLTSGSLSDMERERLVELEKHSKQLESRLSKYEHVEPLPSISKRKRGPSLTGSIPPSPIHSFSISKTLPLTTTVGVLEGETINGNAGTKTVHIHSDEPSSNTGTSPSGTDISLPKEGRLSDELENRPVDATSAV